jgi:hypothetical protein
VALPSIAVTVPTWRRGEMFRQCVTSLLEQDYLGHIEVMCVVDHEPATVKTTRVHPKYGYQIELEDQGNGDLRIAEELQFLAASGGPGGGYSGLRSVRIKRGPGRSNWRPGAIHFPVFEHWLQTKCDYISYQFSDEWSGPTRLRYQMEQILDEAAKWSYCGRVEIAGGDGGVFSSRQYSFNPQSVPTNQLMTPSLLIHRQSFEEVGGLDFPIHAAAKAEEWIQTHCAFLGKPARISHANMYFFREHPESLGNNQKPNSETYRTAIAETGFVEEDHWRLWHRVVNTYNSRIDTWRRSSAS